MDLASCLNEMQSFPLINYNHLFCLSSSPLYSHYFISRYIVLLAFSQNQNSNASTPANKYQFSLNKVMFCYILQMSQTESLLVFKIFTSLELLFRRSLIFHTCKPIYCGKFSATAESFPSLLKLAAEKDLKGMTQKRRKLSNYIGCLIF